MKIAFFLTTQLEYGGGFEKYFIETASNLSDIPDVTVEVITFGDRFNIKLNNLLKFYYQKKHYVASANKENSSSITNRMKKVRYVKIDSFTELRNKFNEFDVIYSKNELLEAFILYFFIGYKKIPPVVFVCGTPLSYPNPLMFREKFRNYLYKGDVYKILTRHVKLFQVKNLVDKAILERMHPNKLIEKIPNSVDYQKMSEMPFQEEIIKNFSKDLYHITWIGRLTTQKGLGRLSDIISIVNNDKDLANKIRWHVVGDGEEREFIKHLCEREKNVLAYGHVAYQNMSSIYKYSNLVLSTSRWESFGYTVVEANVFDVPVISFNITGPNELITNGKNGFLVDSTKEFANKIRELVNSNHVFKNMSAFARDEYSEKVHTERVYKLLKNATL